MRVTYHPDAEVELIEAANFYERQVRGLGGCFLEAFQSTVARIEAQPDWAPIIDGDIRRRSLRRFPYAIYYRVASDELRVLVVKHHSRHPDYWRYRMAD
ncbi:MAG TPA: type II toxin-antitoxin system RelE/ParE family toxin [Pirellulales bacterium]|nr:type II toxin-antitoxin system RelE/ParE family toxin [Pirellulales bacterium]